MSRNGSWWRGRGAVLYGPADGRDRRCVGCHRPIVYGERCQDCQRRLRQRKRRKPR